MILKVVWLVLIYQAYGLKQKHMNESPLYMHFLIYWMKDQHKIHYMTKYRYFLVSRMLCCTVDTHFYKPIGNTHIVCKIEKHQNDIIYVYFYQTLPSS